MMRLVTFRAGGEPRLGVAVDGGVADLARWLPGPAALADVFQSPALSRVRAQAAGSPADYRLDEIEFLPPVHGAEKIICVGINYPARATEYRNKNLESAYPNLFARFPGSFTGHDQPIIRPRASEQLDYEGEIVLVIGRAGRHIPKAEALGYLGGFTLGNEGTVRDWVTHGSRNVTQGKNFDASGSIGPWVVLAADCPPGQPLDLETRVNGIVRQKDSSSRLLWGFAELIEYISTFTTLRPGDLIFSGTPTGSGSHATPPVWLRPGDVVEVEASGIGVLRNTVADES
jgi:2-keto-4-pentenoate hydratase/2-oxohepta-3-ene-1,7-dioic acid hydratase in catechol pathway